MTGVRVGNASTTSPTPPTLPTSATETAAKVSDTGKLNQNFDQFLMLLTTQLKNQDPLSPMDSTQFTNQLVSFSGVEQQIKMNDNLAKMVALSNINQTTLGLSYIGLKVDMAGSNFKYYGAGNGDIKTSYTLPTDSTITKISVVDKNGTAVYAQDGEQTAGSHDFTWNGMDDNGQPVAAGLYEIRVGALDKMQKNITVTTVVPGLVEGVQTATDGAVMLLVNDQEVPMSSVKKATL